VLPGWGFLPELFTRNFYRNFSCWLELSHVSSLAELSSLADIFLRSFPRSLDVCSLGVCLLNVSSLTGVFLWTFLADSIFLTGLPSLIGLSLPNFPLWLECLTDSLPNFSVWLDFCLAPLQRFPYYFAGGHFLHHKLVGTAQDQVCLCPPVHAALHCTTPVYFLLYCTVFSIFHCDALP
jgi:hypothetical protein